MSPAETAAAIDIPFASRTWMGLGKHLGLLPIADRFEANTVLCLFNTKKPSSIINVVSSPCVLSKATKTQCLALAPRLVQ